MSAHFASLINAATLIVMGLWGYFGSDDPSVTALIPVAFGGILIALNNGVKRENKVVAHIAVLLTFLILMALIKPLQGAIGREDTMAIVRVGAMIGTTVWAVICFIKSFIAARKNR